MQDHFQDRRDSNANLLFVFAFWSFLLFSSSVLAYAAVCFILYLSQAWITTTTFNSFQLSPLSGALWVAIIIISTTIASLVILVVVVVGSVVVALLFPFLSAAHL